MLEIKKVSSKKELKQFIMLPFRLYKHDPNWVAPLISDQMKFFNPSHNPYYKHSEVELFIALKDNQVVGRISAQTNTQHNLEHKDKVGFFGFLECDNDVTICQALLDTAAKWNREHGRDIMRGPMNLSVNDECGLLVEGFDTPPMVMMTHHLPYYKELFEKCGLVKVMDLYAYFKHAETIPERVARAAEPIQKRGGYTIRTLDKKNLKREIETVFTVYTEAWQYNWGFVPMTKDEFDYIVQALLPIADPEMVFICEIDGKPAGFCLALPNYNQVLKVMNGRINPITIIKALFAKRKINSARVITMGVIDKYKHRGIDTMFYYHAYKNGIPKGFVNGEFSWVLENNVMMIRVAEMLEAKIYKTYRLYDLTL